jgi:hypothetical protein
MEGIQGRRGLLSVALAFISLADTDIVWLHSEKPSPTTICLIETGHHHQYSKQPSKRARACIGTMVWTLPCHPSTR